MLFEPCSRVLRSLPCRLQKVLVSLCVVQLEGLDPPQVVVVPCPLVVARLLREGGLEHQLVRLVVQVVVQVVPQQAVDQNCLALKVVPQGGSAEASVERGSAGRHQLLLTLAPLLACHLVRPHVVEEALGRDEVQGPPILVLEFGHNLRGALQGFLALVPVNQVDEDEEVHVEVNLEVGSANEDRGILNGIVYLWIEWSGTSLATRWSQRTIKLISLGRFNECCWIISKIRQSHLSDKLEQRIFGVPIPISGVESLHDAAQHNGVHLPPGDWQGAQHTEHEASLKRG